MPPPQSPEHHKHQTNGFRVQNGHNSHSDHNGTNGLVANGYQNDHAPLVIYTNSNIDPNNSLEGTSVDEPEVQDNQAMKLAGRMVVFKKAEEVVTQVAQHLRESQSLCLAGQGEDRSEAAFLRAKELLTTEARQFVTASKLFVKSATESEGQLMECLNHCVHMVDRIGRWTLWVVLTFYTTVFRYDHT